MNIIEIIKRISGRSNIEDFNNSKTREWLSWYSGKIRKFHFYNIYNGTKKIPMERLTLSMPKKVCEDWANLLMNEKTSIILKNEKDQKIFDKHLTRINFYQKANSLIEKTFALGKGAFVESIENFSYNEKGDLIGDDATPNIQFISGNKIYPITFENGQVTECAFVNEGSEYTYISIHLLNENNEYDIHNIKCAGKNKSSLMYNEETDHTVFHTKSKIAWFQLIKPNIVNNIDINSPLGISIYANAIDILKSVDLSYDCLYNELNLGRKRIFISTRLLKVDPVSGETNPVFDQNDIEYYSLPESDDGKNLIYSDSQELRIESIDRALQRQLNLLSSKCGFGSNHYKFETGTVTTATQVVSENSEQFRNLRKHEILLENALICMAEALISIINQYTNEKISLQDKSEIRIEFDDSIIEDKQSEKTSDRQDLQSGVISRAEYRAKYYSEDLETAQKEIKEIAKQNNSQIISDISSIRNDISRKTALALNPYIDDVDAEIAELEKEDSNKLPFLTEEEINAQLNKDVDSTNEGE